MQKIRIPIRQVIDACLVRLATLLGLKQLPTLFNGKWIWLERAAWVSVYRLYEPKMADQLRRHLKHGACFFDIGAHFGLWSLYAAKLVGRRGKVYAFEPSPSFEILSQTAHRIKNIAPWRCGIGKSDGLVPFFDQGNTTSGSFLKSVTEINASFSPGIPIGSKSCSIRSLDSVVNELKRPPQVIKMDIEGHEVEALKGAVELLKSDITWIVEVHPLQLELGGSSVKEVYDIFETNGYQVETLEPPSRQAAGTILAHRA